MRKTIAVGVGVFLLVAPLLAVGRQAAVLLVAVLVASLTNLMEARLLHLLPVDPVYGGAGLRVLGGIEPRGLAVAGLPGLLLHQMLPFFFYPPSLVAPGAAVSALVDPGMTVLARVLTALLATTVLVAIATAAVDRLKRPALVITGRLAIIWLLLDLAHETDLSVRDLEATGLPFALAAFAPVDAHGQRVLLTSHLAGLPAAAVGVGNAVLAVLVCLVAASAIRGIVRLTRRLARCRRMPRLQLDVGAIGAASARLRRLPWPAPLPPGLPNVAALVMVAYVLSLSPFGNLAEGETTVLISPSLAFDEMTTEEALTQPHGDAATQRDSLPEPGGERLAEAPPPGAVDGEMSVVNSARPTPAMPAATSAARSSEGLTRSVVVVEGSGYQYTLKVNGSPTIVRGMGYNPWYAELPIDERRHLYQRDFSAMREVGVNALEGWFQTQFDEVTLDEAHRHGLKVILPFELNQDYDYSDPAIQAMFRVQVTAWVERYRDHPALLMWGPGNEVMHRLIFPTAVQGQRDPVREKRADDFATFYVELIDMIRELDPHHPVVYRDAEDLYFSRLREAMLKDGVRRPWFIYGTNVYTQRLAEVIERWPTQGLDAPLLVSEFSPGGVGESDRPSMLGWYWSSIRAHPKRVIGGVVYTWTTRGPEDLDRVFGLTDESGAPVDGSLGVLRRLYRADAQERASPE